MNELNNSNISNEVPEVDKEKILDPNEGFEENFSRVIGSNEILEEDEEKNEECDEIIEMNDTYLRMEVKLMNYSNREMMRRIVKEWAIDIGGKPVGIRNNNPLVDTTRY